MRRLAFCRKRRANAAMPRLLAAALAITLHAHLVAQAGPPASAVLRVANAASVEQDRVVIASAPFARGQLRMAEGATACAIVAEEVDPLDFQQRRDVRIDGAGLPMMFWPDGSVALLSVHWRARIAASSARAFVVQPKVGADRVAMPLAPSAHRSALPDALPIWTELVDPFGRVLRADLVPDLAAGKDGIVSDTGLVRVRKFRSTHRIQDGAAKGSPLLDLTAFLVTFDGDRRAELTLVLDNREPAHGPLGPVRFSAFRVCFAEPSLRFVPAFARENVLPPPYARDSSTAVQDLLQKAEHFLGDGTAKAFRLHLFLDDASLTDADRQSAAFGPVRFEAFAAIDGVRSTKAWGSFGGPAPVLGSDRGDDRRQLGIWRDNARIGPYGGFGDPEDARLGGAPRHGDSLLHNVLRWRSGALLAVAEGMVLQHSMRPTGGRATRLPKDMAAYRAGLQLHTIDAPHGHPRIDYEHVSAQLLFDYWWITGDEFARDELRRIGASALAMLRSPAFRTGRGEGRCLEAGALAAMATCDASLLASLLAHAVQTLGPQIQRGKPAALPQPPHPLVLDGGGAFDSTSQMAALLRGLAALHRASGESALLPLIGAIADAMAGPAWLEGEGPKTFVNADDASRYSMAPSPEDRSGNDRTLIGAFVIAADLVDDAGRTDLWRRRAAFLLEREIPVTATFSDRLMASANPWLQAALDRRN